MKNALEDLRGRIEYEVRNALLDLQSAADQVAVAKTNVDLATETLTEARDRFAAGVTDNIEVVQTQQLLAAANENYIGSLNAHNGARIALATALGYSGGGGSSVFEFDEVTRDLNDKERRSLLSLWQSLSPSIHWSRNFERCCSGKTIWRLPTAVAF